MFFCNCSLGLPAKQSQRGASSKMRNAPISTVRWMVVLTRWRAMNLRCLRFLGLQLAASPMASGKPDVPAWFESYLGKQLGDLASGVSSPSNQHPLPLFSTWLASVRSFWRRCFRWKRNCAPSPKPCLGFGMSLCVYIAMFTEYWPESSI